LRALLVNHRTAHCGVYQFGTRILKPALESKHYECYYIETPAADEFEHWAGQINPDFVVYNWYPSTMPWVTPAFVAARKTRFKQLCIFHEVPVAHLGFDLVLHQDPTAENETSLGRYMPMSRPIPRYLGDSYGRPDVPTFGSFGFGLGGKGFTELVRRVHAEYDTAHIRLNIPYAAFGDSNGVGARTWASHCQQLVTKPGIIVSIGHDLLDELALLSFLAGNSVNCFFYEENYGRGISGTTDYALAVRRPIAITKSWQFKHLWSQEPSLLVEDRTLQSFIDVGAAHLEKFHTMWSRSQLIEDYERAFAMLGGTE